MQKLQTSFILGYHGCLEQEADKILKDNKFYPSTNDYDWLGSGIYFWESSPARAWQWAEDKVHRREKDEKPAVLGAVIDLGLCLDTMTLEGCHQIKEVYKFYTEIQELLQGDKLKNDSGRRHFLDCAVINVLHLYLKKSGEQPINTVRGIFQEGDPLYEGAMFYEKTHSQVCVRTSGSIKGIFRVRPNEKA